MAQQTINNGESGLVVRGKINDNFTELYTTNAITVTTTGAQTITGTKTFYSGGIKIYNPANTFAYTFVGGAITADYSIAIPAVTLDTTLGLLSSAALGSNRVPFWSGTINSFNFNSAFTYNATSSVLAAPRFAGTSNTTSPALGLGTTLTSDPSGSANGDMWYRSDTNFYRGRVNGTNSSFVTGPLAVVTETVVSNTTVSVVIGGTAMKLLAIV